MKKKLFHALLASVREGGAILNGVRCPASATLVTEPCRDRIFDVVIERDSDGYFVAWVPALPGCHTQARSLVGVTARIQEAISLFLEVERNRFRRR